MGLIKSSLQLSKRIKNAARFKEIVSVLAKHGFSELILKSGLDKVIPDFVLPHKNGEEKNDDLSGEEWWGRFGAQLRLSFEELGPSFIKLGQLMATREDILDPAVIRELKLLQNKVKGISFDEAKRVIESELKKPMAEVFTWVDPQPIGTASIGVVYKATLLTGENVVVKVRRPGIEKVIHTDFELLYYIVQKIESASEEVKLLGLSRMISDFFKSTKIELNFLIEAQNCERLKRNLKLIDLQNDLKVPTVYRQFLTQQVLVLEYLDGKPFNEFTSIQDLPEGTLERLERSIELFTHTLLADGFFHADLHGGNFFVLKDGRIGLIDFGLMGTLSKKNRLNLIAILYSIITYNFDNLVYEFLEVADYETVPDHEELIRDIKDSISPYIGLSVQETNMSELVKSLIQTLSKHELYLPREWYIIFRALMTLDGVGKSIGFDLNIFKILEKDIPKLTTELISHKNSQEELVWMAKDLVTSLRIVPKHLKWFLKEVSKNKYALDIKVSSIDDLGKNLSQAILKLSLSILSAIFFLSGTIFVKDLPLKHLADVPLLAWIFWGMGTSLLVKILTRP